MNHDHSHLSSKAPTRARTRLTAKNAQTTWTEEEDALLSSLMSQKVEIENIVQQISGKTQQQINDRWNKVLNPQLIKGSWTTAEDEFITKWVQENGPRNWSALAASLPGRLGKQCRERWVNNLSPDLLHQPWTEEEDNILIEHQKKWGNKWAKIATLLPGRTDNSVKNRWNSSLKRRLQRIANGEAPINKRGRKPKRASNAPEVATTIEVPSRGKISVGDKECSQIVGEAKEAEKESLQDEIPKPDFTLLDMTVPSPSQVTVTPINLSPFIQMSPVIMKDSPFFPLWSPGTPDLKNALIKSPIRFSFDPADPDQKSNDQ